MSTETKTLTDGKLAKDSTKARTKTHNGNLTKTLTRNPAKDLDKMSTKTKTLADGKHAKDLNWKLARDLAKMSTKTKTPAKKLNKTLRKELAKDLTRVYVKTLTGEIGRTSPRSLPRPREDEMNI
jgi:hypothetical protein